MVRITFPTYDDRVRGNYLLATKSRVSVLRGGIFEVSEAALKLLDEHQIPYQVIPIPTPTESDQEVRNPLTFEL